MSEWVDEWMGCENSKYEALFTILLTTDKKQRSPYPPLLSATADKGVQAPN